MLSIIICSISPEYLQQVTQNIYDTIGVECEVIGADNRNENFPIAHVYNEGARKAQYPFLFFVHEDVKFYSQDWGRVIEEKLSQPDCGIIGFAGCKVKLRTYSGWGQDKRWACTLFYQVKRGTSLLHAMNVISGKDFEEVVSVDGLGMFVRKEVWEKHPFDEEMLTGFHCYDLDFSLQIASTGQYRNYVCTSPKVLIEHFSEGNYNRNWCQETIRLHDYKWTKILPLMAEGVTLSNKEVKYHEERCFNRFVCKMLKTDYSEKWTVLKAFILYPQYSWKHLWHCISNLSKYIIASFNK